MPSVDSINKAVCFGHFPPFFLFFWHNAGSKLWQLSLEKNRYWHHQRCHRLHVIMLWPSFAFKFSYVNSPNLPPLPVQSSCMPLIPIADTGLEGWLNRRYTHLAAGHRSTTSHKVATMYCLNYRGETNPKLWTRLCSFIRKLALDLISE